MFSAPYSGFSGVIQSSEVKHLKDLFITHTAGEFSTTPRGHQRAVSPPGAAAFRTMTAAAAGRWRRRSDISGAETR